jgi:hypothetical protein
MYVVIVGDLVAGISDVIGQFDSFEEARDWAETNVKEAWCVFGLSEPNAAHTNAG